MLPRDPSEATTGGARYAIAYRRFSEPLRNADFQGKGWLEVRGDGELLLFSGKRRAAASSASEPLPIAAHEIFNASRVEERITFKTTVGESGLRDHPFLFYCRNEEEARQIFAQLPEHASPEFARDSARRERLDTVCPPLPPYLSPTYLLIGLNSLVFVLMAAFTGAGWFDTGDLEPYREYGANHGGHTTHGEWYRLLTSSFLHFGVLHVAINMWALAGAGALLERLVGWVHFFLIYFGAAAFGALCSIIWFKDSIWSAGSSGAIFGIYGSLIASHLRYEETLPTAYFSQIRTSTVCFLAYNLLFGIVQPGIDNAAHAGGLAAGFLLGLTNAVPVDRDHRPRQLRRALPVTAITCGALILGGAILSPSFAYDPQEEAELSAAHEAFAADERALIEELAPLLANADQASHARQAAAKQLQRDVIPFYEHWRQQFSGRHYAQESRTERNCRRLERYAATRVEAFTALEQAMRGSRVAPQVERYLALLEEANEQLRDFE